jgi:hypothetical protein
MSILGGRRSGCAFIVLASLTVAGVAHAQTTNSWIVPSSGKWERVQRWDNGLPSTTQSAVIISNDSSKVVMINARTARRFPDSLTISNLAVNAQPGDINTVFLDRTRLVALHILDGLGVGALPSGLPGGRSRLISVNSTLVVDGLLGGQLEDDGTVVVIGGSLITTNCSLQVGDYNAAGLLRISRAMVQARDVTITSGTHSSGTIEVRGGTMTLSSSLTVGNGFDNAPGAMLVANGAVVVVTNDETDIGGAVQSSGSLMVSHATFLAADIFLGGTRSDGELTINNGTVTLGGELGIGAGGEQCSGSVTLNGGRLVVTNGETRLGVGSPSNGNLAISDGLFLARDVYVGANESEGALFIDGGVSILSSNLQIGVVGSEATVSITGGQLFVTNAALVVDEDGECNVFGGQLAARIIDLGIFDDGTLTVDGGSVTVDEGITLGDCDDDSAVGFALVAGGELIVTNIAGGGFIDVRNGQLILGGGVVRVDKLVMTNTFSSLVHTGGTLIVGSVVLDPDAFGVTAVDQEGNDVRVTWLMGPGQTNALQAASVSSHLEQLTTNDFVDIFVVTNNTTPGVVTNYLDVGAATNVWPRVYRAELLP